MFSLRQLLTSQGLVWKEASMRNRKEARKITRTTSPKERKATSKTRRCAKVCQYFPSFIYLCQKTPRWTKSKKDERKICHDRTTQKRYKQTCLFSHRPAMRLPFGATPTEEYGNTMKGLGALGMEGSGVIRANVREEKGMKGMYLN